MIKTEVLVQQDLPMSTDVVGKVNNFPLRHDKAPLAVFEAIVNAIHSIWERKSVEGSEGRITVEFVLDPEVIAREAEEGKGFIAPVRDVNITDNGVGFSKVNYDSFRRAETTHKMALGGRGVGRFAWLKCFDHVEVSSFYQEAGIWYRRQFQFVLDDINPLRDNRQEALDPKLAPSEPTTTIYLCGLRKPYHKYIPRTLKEFGKQIIDHHISYFVGEQCPEITLRESYEVNGEIRSDERILNQQFTRDFVLFNQLIPFEVAGLNFSLRILFVRLADPLGKPDHQVLWCGNDRVVVEHPLSPRYVPDLNKEPLPFGAPAQQCSVVCLVQGAFLGQRENLSSERTNFTFPERRTGNATFPTGPQDLTQQDIADAIKPLIEETVSPYLTLLRSQNQRELFRKVSDTLPQYRDIVSRHPEMVRHLTAKVTPQNLDYELYKVKVQLTIEAKAKVAEFLREKDTGIAPADGITPEQEATAHQEKLQDILQYVNDISRSDLAAYVINRKLVIDMLHQKLSRDEATGKYPLEKELHSIIFPMQKTSDDQGTYDNQNLWLLDERFAYHRFLTSDKHIDPTSRPDILAGFDDVLLYSDSKTNPHSSFVIVEFKRPMRNNYNPDDDNPLSQVLRYLRVIRDGKATTGGGRMITAAEGCRYYIYIVCDMTPRAVEILEDADYTRTVDREGYFKPNSTHNAYIEVISYDKVVNDAVKRNQVLFDKLHIRPSHT